MWKLRLSEEDQAEARIAALRLVARLKVPARLAGLLEECQALYDRLSGYRLTPCLKGGPVDEAGLE